MIPKCKQTENRVSNLENANVYSTEEQVIGKWIDGKNLYRKVIIGTIGQGDSSRLHDIAENINVIDFKGLINYDAGKFLIPISYTNPSAPIYSYIDYNNKMVKLVIIVPGTDFNNKNFYSIVEYTKTTD